MKKYAPYFLVILVIAILALLFYRWQQTNKPTPQISPEGISVEELTPEEQSDLLKGVKDYQEVEFQPTSRLGTLAALGTLRYLVSDGKFKFSAVTQLPAGTQDKYFVWVRSLSSDQWHLAFELESKKGGMLGSAALPADVLPAEVVISKSNDQARFMDEALLKATVPVPEE